jgi:cobalt-zinc-cadmium efflux system outer membrane protein
LTEEDAVKFGLQYSPQIAAGIAGVASADANYRSVAALNTIDFGATRVQGTSTAPSLTGENSDTILDVGTTFDTSGQRRFQAAGARAQLGVTRYQFDETKLTLVQQIRDAYWSLVAARAQTRIAQEIFEQAQRVNALTRSQQAAGAAPQVDVVRSSIDVANAQQSLVSTQGAEIAALSALNVLLGRGPMEPIALADSISETPTSKLPLPDLPNLEDLTRSALTKRALVKSAQEAVRVAEYTLKQTRASRLPDLAVDYERSVQQPQPVDSLVLTVRFPLLDLGSIRHSERSATEARKQAEAELRQAEQQVAQQVAQGQTDYLQARKLATSYFTDILTPSLQLVTMAELGYKQGATGILPVIDAQNTLRNARNGYVSAILALYKARHEVDAALGGP